MKNLQSVENVVIGSFQYDSLNFLSFQKIIYKKYLGIKFKLNSDTQLFAVPRVNVGRIVN